ncbi:MAG: Ppx/GppA family phosphatase, partial [Nostoc sp.]
QSLLTKQQRQIVSQLSAILRLAVALDRRQIGAVAQVQCEYYSQLHQVNLLIFPTQLDDDCDLELWSLNYKKGVFEEEFGVKLVASLEKSSIPNLS